MRVVIVTPEDAAHHRHLCVRLVSGHDVVGVLHPEPRASDVRTKVGRARRQLRRSGVVQTALRALATTPTPLAGWHAGSATHAAEGRFFPDVDDAYRDIVAPLAHHVRDVNGDETLRLVRDLAPDAVVCLGGPIYGRELVEACQPMFNFHSGVSPLYNGASTIMFAFANGHFRLCGGTLMTMSPVVDGGDILAHVLPAIEAADTPATLFMKTVAAAAEAYDRFLAHLASGAPVSKARQPPPLFTCRADDWTVYQSQRVRRHIERRAPARFARDDEAIDYWALPSDRAAEEGVRTTVARLLELA